MTHVECVVSLIKNKKVI